MWIVPTDPQLNFSTVTRSPIAVTFVFLTHGKDILCQICGLRVRKRILRKLCPFVHLVGALKLKARCLFHVAA